MRAMMNKVSMNIVKVLFFIHVLVNIGGKVNWRLNFDEFEFV
jgi:hypothetical protein